jgi:hypothetical protein
MSTLLHVSILYFTIFFLSSFLHNICWMYWYGLQFKRELKNYHLYFLPMSSFRHLLLHLFLHLHHFRIPLSSSSSSSSVPHTLSHASFCTPVVSLHCPDTHFCARRAWDVKTALEPDQCLDQIDLDLPLFKQALAHSSHAVYPLPLQLVFRMKLLTVHVFCL